MTVNEIMAIAAHLHVILRRKTGRVTDIEWLVANADYAKAIVDFAKAKARELSDTDLELWALKLELANAQRPTRINKPLVQVAVESVHHNHVAGEVSDFMPSDLSASQPAVSLQDKTPTRYVGGIR
jgi:hypothetical protein